MNSSIIIKTYFIITIGDIMFYRYEIRNNGKEDILYLYSTMNYEFSKELDNNTENNLEKSTENFIKNNSIDFNGNKIYLVVDGIIVKTLEIDKKDEKITVKNNMYSNNLFTINLKDENNIITKIDLTTYLLGVIATNSILDLELETLKALTLLYRTYAFKEMKENNFISTKDNFQSYNPIESFKSIWKNNYQYYYDRIKKAIEETNGEFLTYEDEYILPFIHICSNTLTEASNKYEYVEKVTSLWDYASPYYLEIKDYNYNDLEKIFNMKKKELKKITILEVSKSNQIKRIKINDTEYTGEEFKSLLNLKSADINMIINPTHIRFITKGWGNNMGLSQFGSNELAKQELSYIKILNYYFPKVKIKRYI